MESRRTKVQEIKKKFEVLCDDNGRNVDLSGGKNVIVKRTPAFRTSKRHFPVTTGAPGQSDSVPSTGGVEGLAPLPRGPAPRKPPRTFAHTSRPSSGGSATLPPPMSRSRTEPLIMLKKIEEALLGTSPTLRQNGTTVKKPLIRSSNNVKPVISKKPDPVYSEPCIVKNPARQPGRSPQSLYYMSTPIVDRSNGWSNSPASVNSRNKSDGEIIKKVQSWMLDPQRCENDSDADSAKEIAPEKVEERKIYARRVSSLRLPSRAKDNRSHRVMDVLLLVGIDSDANNGKVAYIKSKYPVNAEVVDNIACLIFPDADSWPPLTGSLITLPASSAHNNYTVVLTSADGTRSYAYCRRLQPEGSLFCLPLAYAILTPHKANTFYYKILEEIENKHGLPENDSSEFLRKLYLTNFPKESHSVTVGDIELPRAQDSRQDSHDIARLLQAVRVPLFVNLLSNLLLEKKVILISSNISLLSDSIEGLQKALYPFEWPYTLITALPPPMFEVLQSITPYLLGLLRTKSHSFPPSFFHNVDHVFVLDLDKGTIVWRSEDDASVLPERSVKALNVALYLTPVHTNDVAPSEALIKMFVELIGHYTHHFSYVQPHKRQFKRDSFVKTPSSKSVRQFLEWFTETSMFQMFIESHTVPRRDLFDLRCSQYAEENMKRGKIINRTVKTLGDRFKDWTHST